MAFAVENGAELGGECAAARREDEGWRGGIDGHVAPRPKRAHPRSRGARTEGFLGMAEAQPTRAKKRGGQKGD